MAILLYGGSEYLLDKMSFKPFTTFCYIFGIISFEIMTRYSNIKEIFELVHEFKIWMKN